MKRVQRLEMTMVLAVILTACAPEPERLGIAYLSENNAEDKGMALSGDGTWGQIGVLDTSCLLYTPSGGTGAEIDVIGPDDKLQDGFDDVDLGFVTVTVGNVGVHVHTPLADVTQFRHWTDVTARHARLTEDVVLVVADSVPGCIVAFQELDGTVLDTVPVPASVCDRDADLAVDRERSELYATIDDSVIRVDEHGFIDLNIGADHIAWDTHAQALYAAVASGDRVTAFERDGRRRWRERVPGEIRDLETLGPHAGALVALKVEGGPGALWLLDGERGQVRMEAALPEPVKRLQTSPDGGLIAAVRTYGTVFLEVWTEEALAAWERR